MLKYDVFYNKILKINSDKEFLKLLNGKSTDDILKLQKSFTEFFLNNFDDRLQEIVVLRNSSSNVNINEELFIRSHLNLHPHHFYKIPFIILSFLILFLIISTTFFYFFKIICKK